jgi:hypothetical protein
LLNDTDAEGDALHAVLITPPQHATPAGFTLNPNGTFSYTHDGGTASTDTFQYVAFDEHNAQSEQTVTVVINIADAPAAEWQNPLNRFDVNNDGFVSPIDVLLLINYINANWPNVTLPSPRPPGAPFYDVNGDGSATSLDVLLVIGQINFENSQGEGEYFVTAEGEASPASPAIMAPATDIGLPSTDQTGQLVPTEPGIVRSDPVQTSDHDQRPALKSQYTQPDTDRSRANRDETIHVDPFGVEDILSTIAEDVNGSLDDRTPLDDLLEEMLG